jgi:hypothetical protein
MIEKLNRAARRLLLLLAGWAFVGLEAYGTWEFLSEKHGSQSFMTLSGVAITAAGAGLLPFAAEEARRNGHKGLKWSAWFAVPMVMTFVFMSSVQRTGSATDKDDAADKQRAAQILIARKEEGEAEKQKPLDQGEVAKNCTPWGPKCQKAKDDAAATEAKLSGARAVLKVHGVATSNSLAIRLVAIFPFWTADRINLYVPLIQPFCLSLLGTIFLANGYSNGKTPPKEPRGWRSWRWRREPEAEPGTAIVAMPPPAKRAPGDVTEFLRAELRPSPVGSIEILSLYPHYRRWCSVANKEPLSARAFRREVVKRIDDAGFPRRGDIVTGLRFKPKLIDNSRQQLALEAMTI